MKYSIVNGEKTEAFKGGKGICICCNSETIAKCGNINVNHWAHRDLSHCDKWWESESDWHRQWKNLFPVKNQEVIHYDSVTGEKHIADIKTDKGLVIELQNSSISIQELYSREKFYGNMIWIVNAIKFKKNIHFFNKLPYKNSNLFSKYKFSSWKKNNATSSYYNKSDYKILKIDELIRSFSIEKLTDEIENEYKGHHLFDWEHKRKVWYTSNRRVFLDFHDEFIYEFMFYDEFGLRCIKKTDREKFIKAAVASCS